MVTLDAIRPYLVRKGRLVHILETERPEEIGHVSQRKNFFHSEMPGLGQALLNQAASDPPLLKGLFYRQGPDFAQILPGDMKGANTHNLSGRFTYDEVPQQFVYIMKGPGKHDLAVRVPIDQGLNGTNVRKGRFPENGPFGLHFA